jgi:hypothetical protein
MGLRCHIRRVSVGAGVTVAIQPPLGVGADQIDIGNAGTTDLKVFSEDPATYADGDNWLIVSAGYDHVIGAPRISGVTPYRFGAGEVAIWVQYADPAATGTVVLTWL